MYENLGAQPGGPPANTQANPFGNAFSGASSGFIRGGLGAYGEKILGSSSQYVQSNVSFSLVYFICIGFLKIIIHMLVVVH